MGAQAWIGLALALLSAVVTNTAYSLEHDAAAALPPLLPSRPFRSARLLLHDRRWIAGFATESAGWIVYLAALRLAPLALVQAVTASGVAVLVVLFFPNRHPMFDFVDDVTTGGESFGAMPGTYAYPDGHVADRQVSDAVNAGGVLDSKSADRFGKDALAFLHGEWLERFILEMTDGKAFVMVSYPTFE